LYEVLTGVPVFSLREMLATIVRRLRAGDFPSIADAFGSFMQRLIPRLWSLDQRSRPSFNDILDEFTACDFQILPGVDSAVVRQSVCEVLDWEKQGGNVR
jgi:hypothetical protein